MPGRTRRGRMSRSSRGNSNARRSKSLVSGNADTTLTMTGRQLLAYSQSATSSTRLVLSPTNIAGTAAIIAQGFQEFRFLKIQCILHPTATGAGNGYTLAYFPVAQGTSTVTTTLYNAAASRYVSGFDTTSAVLNVTSKTLNQTLRKWFATDNTSSVLEPADTQQGCFILDVETATSTPVRIEFVYVLQFRSPTTIAIGDSKVQLEIIDKVRPNSQIKFTDLRKNTHA